MPIIYFSSSGNTKYICQVVSRGLNAADVQTELISLKKSEKFLNLLENTECFGIGAPIYGMNFTPNLIEWMQTIPKSNKRQKFFLIDTNAGLSGDAISRPKKILTDKGYSFIGGLEITVPTRDSVFWMSFYDQVTWKQDSLKRAYYFGEKIAHMLMTGTSGVLKEYKRMPFGNVLSKLFSYIERRFFSLATKLLAHNPYKCKKCGVCEKLCTVGAINVEAGIFFDPKKCILCFKCFRHCPEEALFIRILPNVKFFKGPFQIKGYIKADEINF
ncbi:MAG: EFR1 family ferrodoxin [Candidatus Helarchaeota archaeon]